MTVIQEICRPGWYGTTEGGHPSRPAQYINTYRSNKNIYLKINEKKQILTSQK